ncbi:MAG: MFS transporter [Bdellovibrionales bacterium]
MRAAIQHISASRRTYLTILVAALGYFVDVFDIQLFGIVRVRSLQALGLSPEEITDVGAMLLNWQMAGMLLGGLVWGMLGDKKGRVYVLFATILLYSLGNIANAFVETIPQYAAARFVAGFGLAGEIGAGITLASELIPKETRSYATVLIAICGTMGPIAGSMVANAMDWRWAYAVGGCMGLMLLFLRISVHESGMFETVKKQPGVRRGHFRMFFNKPKRFLEYLGCIALAVPIWFMIGIVVVFSPEVGVALGIGEPLQASSSVISFFVGQTIGGIGCGLLSQVFRNRRAVIAVFMLGAAATLGGILLAKGISANGFYALLMLASVFCGYWGLFLTVTAECFGTNLRTLAVSTVSNFVRASVIIDTLSVAALKPLVGLLGSIAIVGGVGFVLALLAVWKLPETFARDLNFVER